MERITGKYKNVRNNDIHIDKRYSPGDIIDTEIVPESCYHTLKESIKRGLISKVEIEASNIQVSEEKMEAGEDTKKEEVLEEEAKDEDVVEKSENKEKAQESVTVNEAQIERNKTSGEIEQEAIDFVNQHHKKVEKEIREIDDTEQLELYLKAAKNEIRNGAARVIEERINELKHTSSE